MNGLSKLTQIISRHRRQRLPRTRSRGRRAPRIEGLETRWLPSTLSLNNAFVVEGDSQTTDAVFTVNLFEASAQTVTVNFHTANGTAVSQSDYQEQTGTLTFAPGETSHEI